MTTRSSLRFLTATAGASLLLASCAVGPKAPDATLPPSASGAFIGAAVPAVTAEAARDDWWRLYDDPALDALVRVALVENNELEAAAANLRRVRAALGEARTGRLPSTTTSASGQYGRASAATVPGGNGGQPLDEGETYDAGLDVAYEVDLFGLIFTPVFYVVSRWLASKIPSRPEKPTIVPTTHGLPPHDAEPAAAAPRTGDA